MRTSGDWGDMVQEPEPAKLGIRILNQISLLDHVILSAERVRTNSRVTGAEYKRTGRLLGKGAIFNQ
jgi:hypothetical protein